MKPFFIVSLYFIVLLCHFDVIAQSFPVKIEGYAQGTTYHITYYDSKKRNFQPKIEKILTKFDQSVSTYQPNSVISKVNNNVPKVKLDAYFLYCFTKAKTYYSLTESVFDPTIYPLTNIWGFGPEKKENLSKVQIDSVLQFVGFDKINLVSNEITKKDPRIKLDFNGFAQGYSVDVIAQYLEKKGITTYLVEIGGEVYAKGVKPDHSLWTIGVEKPIDNLNANNSTQMVLQLNGKAIATSGDYHKFFKQGTDKYGHHFDPKTGYPKKNTLLSCTVVTDTCIDADAISTAIIVMGLDKAINFLNLHPEYQAIIMYDNVGKLEIFETQNIQSYIKPIEK